MAASIATIPSTCPRLVSRRKYSCAFRMVKICAACAFSAISSSRFQVPGNICSYSHTACGGGNGACHIWICCSPDPIPGAYGNVIESGEGTETVCPLAGADAAVVSRGPVAEVGGTCGERLLADDGGVTGLLTVPTHGVIHVPCDLTKATSHAIGGNEIRIRNRGSK
jgi:hypothetical protein